MPFMDGLEATRRIKAMPGGKETIIVALTASVFKDQRNEVLEAGCDDFVRKPLNEDEIFEMMAKHLSVQYVYGAGSRVAGSALQIPDQEALTPEVLATLPADLVGSLEQAVIHLKVKEIDRTINVIRSHNAEIAGALAGLAKNFKYKEIWNMIQQSRKLSV
jgi:CheY-like chemotaxis protein